MPNGLRHQKPCQHTCYWRGFFISLFGDAVSQNNIGNEILATEQELKHLGSCTTKGLTNKKIAQLDERFFWP